LKTKTLCYFQNASWDGAKREKINDGLECERRLGIPFNGVEEVIKERGPRKKRGADDKLLRE